MTEAQVLIDEFVRQRVWAVVGYSESPQKWGHILVHSLRRSGYLVYPVNPRGGRIAGERAYRSVLDLPRRPGVVNLVVPPRSTEQVVVDCLAARIQRIWMQPGAESESAIAFCRQHGMEVLYGVCALIEKRDWSSGGES